MMKQLLFTINTYFLFRYNHSLCQCFVHVLCVYSVATNNVRPLTVAILLPNESWDPKRCIHAIAGLEMPKLYFPVWVEFSSKHFMPFSRRICISHSTTSFSTVATFRYFHCSISISIANVQMCPILKCYQFKSLQLGQYEPLSQSLITHISSL